MSRDRCCILSKFYIKPQQYGKRFARGVGCILSKFYIKPQLLQAAAASATVVSYRNSTSNHNVRRPRSWTGTLYLIEILHQTTTLLTFFMIIWCCILSKFYIKPQLMVLAFSLFLGCILSKFYIKPQPNSCLFVTLTCCILSKFYIKPQQEARAELAALGCILSKFYIKPQPPPSWCCPRRWLYLIEILHQTTTASSP